MSDRPDDTSSKSSKSKAKQETHPGMMGDETEEQNVNQPGNPKARISRDEVQDAFKKEPPAKK
jgi:hypothetical protein